MTPLNRRTFVGAAAAATAATAVGLPTGQAQAAEAGAPLAAAAARPTSGSVKDVRHVVILMQENRSFDHYFGALAGVRGFSDRQALVLPGGDDVFRQPAPGRTDGGYLLPYRMDSTKYNAQNAGGLPHDWATGQTAVNNGAQNRWVAAKGERAMGYFTREDIPYQYALADAFTVCDAYFTSLNGPTDPNRLYLWSGTAGPGRDGTTGPWTDNTPVTDNPVADWTTYAERLQDAGVSWRVYHNPSKDERYGDYDDNGLSYFRQFHAFAKDDPRYINAMTKWDLSAFDAHCKDGTLPTVSWLVAPYLFSEHPDAGPNYGAHWVNTAMQSMFANPEVWKHTVFLLMYDENDGYFDHVVPPLPEPGTPEEFVDGRPIGLGTRVPLWIASPWSRGGYVNSQVADHTSVVRFLEVVTGVREPNISAWRRSVCGDLTSCFDFTRPDYTIPTLPDTNALIAKADAAKALPGVKLPEVGRQEVPAQEPGVRPHRPLPYRPWAEATVDRATGKVVCTLVNDGAVTYHFTVFPNVALPFTGTPFTVPAGTSATYTWDAAGTDGVYDFSVHGADGFVRRFAGTVVRGAQRDIPIPSVRAELRGRKPAEAKLDLHLANDGDTPVRFTITPNDFGGTARTQWLQAHDRNRAEWPADAHGRFDVTVTAADGYARRYAGTVHPQAR